MKKKYDENLDYRENSSVYTATVYKNSQSGKWEEGYPYLRYPTDENDEIIMPGDRRWRRKLRKSKTCLWGYIPCDSSGESFATEYKEVEKPTKYILGKDKNGVFRIKKSKEEYKKELKEFWSKLKN